MTRGIARLVVVAALMVAGVAAADLPRLPKELKLPRGSDSPGQVVFSHESHVDAAKPACLGCHPKLFSILGRSRVEARAPLTHATMEKGQGCGACHGKAAFGFDDCTACHAK